MTTPLSTVAAAPKRIQRKRTRGWRMTGGAVYVGRPTKYGNPFKPEAYWAAGYPGTLAAALQHCCDAYRAWLEHREHWAHAADTNALKRPDLEPLRGKDLACWCPLVNSHGEYCPCHADVLLSIANNIPIEEVIRENTRRAKGEAV